MDRKPTLVSKWKKFLRRAAIFAALITVLAVSPTFVILLLHIDDPRFGSAMGNLLLGSAFSFVFIFLVILVFGLGVAGIVMAWRRYHPRATQSIKPIHDVAAKSEMQPLALTTETPTPPHSTWQAILVVTGGISGFLYLMYYVGRAYTQGYFSAVGVPQDFIRFEVQDYVYVAAQVDTILITAAFVSVIVGLLMTQFLRRKEPEVLPKSTFEQKVFLVMVLGYLGWYALALLLFALYKIFRPDLLTKPPFVLVTLVTCMFTLGLPAIILLVDKEMQARIRDGRFKRNLFLGVVIISLALAPSLSSEAWGAYKGLMVQATNLPQVSVYADRKLSDSIGWVSVDGETYKSDQKLYLLAKTPDFLILKTANKTDGVIIVKLSDVVAISVLNGVQIK